MMIKGPKDCGTYVGHAAAHVPPPDDGRLALTQNDVKDLTWYHREAVAATGGLGAQGYGPTGDHAFDPGDAIVRAFGRVKLSERVSFVEAVRDQMLWSDGGDRAWVVLGWAFGLPRRDDPWQDFAREPELAPLVRHCPTLLAVTEKVVGIAQATDLLERSYRSSVVAIRKGASPIAEAARIFSLSERRDPNRSPGEVGRQAVRVWEIAFRSKAPPKKDPMLCAQVRIEAREMFASASDAYRQAKLLVSAISRRGRNDARREEEKRDVGEMGPASTRLLEISTAAE